MNNKNSAYKMNYAIFWPIVIIMIALIALSFANQEWFSKVISGVLTAEVINFKWSVGPIVLFMFITMLAMTVHPIGKVRLGGDEARPNFSNFSYWGLCICSTIAIGIVFWGVAEPMNYFMNPWIGWGLEPGSPGAAVKAIAQTNLEWAWGQYALYGIFAIAIGVAVYNYDQPMRTSSFLFFLRGKPSNEKVNTLIDIICLIGIIAGVTCSLGTGTMQMSAGLNAILGIGVSKALWLIVEIIVVIGFVLMSIGGIAKGIKIVTDQNLRLYIIILALMLFIGPTVYILDMLFESTGLMFGTFVQSITYTGGINSDDSPIFWMIWLYVSAAAFAPIVGMFLAKISYGRTIKEVVIGTLIMPSLINVVWFTVFGSMAFEMQTSGKFDIWGAIQGLGLEAAMFQFFAQLPFGTVFQVVFWITIYISFVTLASSATTTTAIATMTQVRELKEGEEPPITIKSFWAALMAVSAFVFISYAGIEGAKSFALIGGLPTLILGGLAAVCVWRISSVNQNTNGIGMPESKSE